MSREQLDQQILELIQRKEEQDAVREFVSCTLVGKYLKDHISRVTFEKADYYTDFPSLQREAIKSCDYIIECSLDLFPGISRENIEIAKDFDPRYWRRIKGGPNEFLDGGYMSVQKVHEYMYARLDEATEICVLDNRYYFIQPFTYNGNSVFQEILLDNAYRQPITVFINFSIPVISFKNGYLDDEESFDLLAVPFNPLSTGNKTDLWLVTRCGLDKVESKLREKEINKKPEHPHADEKLISYLEKVKKKYLVPRYLKNPQPYEKLVVQKKVVEQLLQLHLGDIFEEVMLAGGSYEMTAIPGIADYDLECCLKMPSDVSAANVEECGYKGWRRIRGGPIQFLEGEYLSVQKVRGHVYKKLEDVIKGSPSGTRYGMELKEFDRGSASIKMIIKDGPESRIDVDLVLCIKLRDLRHPTEGHSYGLIAKAYNRKNPDECTDLWRITVSMHEVLMFESQRFNTANDSYEERWYTYQHMKLIKRAEENKVLSIFPSYFYKQAFMLQIADCADKPLDIRFKEYIYGLVKALEQHRLIERWIPDGPNLLDRWSPEEVKPAKEFLKRILSKGSYYELLEPVMKPSFKLY